MIKKENLVFFILFCAFILNSCCTIAPYKDKKLSPKERAKDLLARMTLEEKIDILGGYKSFYIKPNKRLGIPKIRMSDGPVGVRNYCQSTAYPAGICLAATWSRSLANSMGKALGKDARARGVHILLGPGLNIHRVPVCGRNFEYLGEDPFLASVMAENLVKGIQSQKVMATIKHYVANNHESDRLEDDSIVDERTLREIYFPAFKAAIKKAKAACVMSAYNKVNGYYCTENDFINNKILKKEWGFDGILMSDWGATHSTKNALLFGLDLEMPSGKYLNKEKILPLIKKGEISEKLIDDKVFRILYKIIEFGFLDHEQKTKEFPTEFQENRKLALNVAREGIVLLKNKGILPVNKSKIKKIVVIGPNAHPAVTGGGGSSYTNPYWSISILEGIKSIAEPEVEVIYSKASNTYGWYHAAKYSTFYYKDKNGKIKKGVKAYFFKNKNLEGKPSAVKIYKKINFNWGSKAPFKGFKKDNFSVRFEGFIKPKHSGDYFFQIMADDGFKVYLDNEIIMKSWKPQKDKKAWAKLKLEAGKRYDIKVEYFEAGGRARIHFGYTPQQKFEDTAVSRVAKTADYVIVCVGFNKDIEREGFDRSYNLPAGQKELILDALNANKNTIVILNSGGSVDWDGWVDKVPALIEAWYPGEEGGKAIAEIIFGKVNPSGKLPATFPKKWDDLLACRNFPSKNSKLEYKEGIFIGYRDLLTHGKKAMFPFGFGLSYTNFEYKDLKLSSRKLPKNGRISVSLKIKNTGKMAGKEIVQLYIRDIDSSVPRPYMELKGFKKIFLKPKQEKEIKFDITTDKLMFFDPKTKKWKAEPGKFEVFIGSSSEDIKLKGEFELTD